MAGGQRVMRGSGGKAGQGRKPRTVSQQRPTNLHTDMVTSAVEAALSEQDEQPAPWVVFANLILSDPLPNAPTDSEGFAVMRQLLYGATTAHIEGDAQGELSRLQALVFVAQHYAHQAHQHLMLQHAATSMKRSS